MTGSSPGQRAYEAYWQHQTTPGILTDWGRLRDSERAAWDAAAQAVLTVTVDTRDTEEG